MNLRELWAAARRWYEAHTGRDRQVLLSVGVAVVLSLLYVGVFEPLRDHRRGVAQAIEEGQNQLEQFEKTLRREPEMRVELEDIERRLDQAKERLLPGDSGTLGAAALQERANALASEKGITVQSTQVMKEEPADPFRKVTVRFTLSGELRPFAELLAGLEYGPYEVAMPFVEASRRGAGVGAKGPRTLTATVEVSGYVLEASKRRKRAEKEEVLEGEIEGPPVPVEEEVGPPAPVTAELVGPPLEAASPALPGAEPGELPESPEGGAPLPGLPQAPHLAPPGPPTTAAPPRADMPSAEVGPEPGEPG